MDAKWDSKTHLQKIFTVILSHFVGLWLRSLQNVLIINSIWVSNTDLTLISHLVKSCKKVTGKNSQSRQLLHTANRRKTINYFSFTPTPSFVGTFLLLFQRLRNQHLIPRFSLSILNVCENHFFGVNYCRTQFANFTAESARNGLKIKAFLNFECESEQAIFSVSGLG
jgi:hypothetical protein